MQSYASLGKSMQAYAKPMQAGPDKSRQIQASLGKV
jgi:hypothetical protein